MSETRNVLTVPPGAPFLATVAETLLAGDLIPGADFAADRLLLASTTIYVPTRRAARNLAALLVERLGDEAAILPAIRPLGDFDEDGTLFDGVEAEALSLDPPVGALERILALAPLVNAWKRRLPAHVASLFGAGEPLVVPASMADAIWLARDLAALMDEVETSEGDFARLASIVPAELAGWWQVTLEFLRIVTEFWPGILAERRRMNPAARRRAGIDAEAARILRTPGPIVAAGSTGSIPATARLLAAIARHPQGAVVLPGLDPTLDAESWSMLDGTEAISAFGHPQFLLKKLIETIGVRREEVREIGSLARPAAARRILVSEALRPAESTDKWAGNGGAVATALADGALDHVTLVEAANEHEEALAIAIALRRAAAVPGRRAALVTSDRNLARRVSAELLRFGIRADDSGGSPLSASPPARLLQRLAEVCLRPGDPAALIDLFSHPLLLLGRTPSQARRMGALTELALLRGGTGRPDIVALADALALRRTAFETSRRRPLWAERISQRDWDALAAFLADIGAAVAPLTRLPETVSLSEALTALVRSFEAIGRDRDGNLDPLYAGDAGARLAATLAEAIATAGDVECQPGELPDILPALLGGEMVKPSAAGDGRIAIWGALEARLQAVDVMIIGGLNEATWPRKAETGPFLSRLLGAGIGLEPPERRIGQAAHDFMMAMGNPEVVLTRSARVDGAPATPSRWLQRLMAVAGEAATAAMSRRGAELTGLAAAIDRGPRIPPATQPRPTPPVEVRPRHFSVTEIELLRRDPYAIYARHILRLEPLEPLIGEPGPAERGILFHDIVHRFTSAGIDPEAPEALDRLTAIARQCLVEAELPADIGAVWWARIERMLPALLGFEAGRNARVTRRCSEISAGRIELGTTGITLSGRADRIDLVRHADGTSVEILDFKTGTGPSKAEAHILLAPQLALEGALAMHGAFADLGTVTPSDLLYVRLKANGEVVEESILKHGKQTVDAAALSLRAWQQAIRLMEFYQIRENGYLSRALPQRERAMDGDYDHLARVREWSAGAGLPEVEE